MIICKANDKIMSTSTFDNGFMNKLNFLWQTECGFVIVFDEMIVVL